MNSISQTFIENKIKVADNQALKDFMNFLFELICEFDFIGLLLTSWK